MKGSGKKGSFTRGPKDMLNKALEMGSVSIGYPLLGNMKGRSFPRAFERGEKVLYLGKFL